MSFRDILLFYHASSFVSPSRLHTYGLYMHGFVPKLHTYRFVLVDFNY